MERNKKKDPPMDCLSAQSRIADYVDGNLKDEELIRFIEHVKQCDNCKDELEIFYTMVTATKQLDEGKLKTLNFRQELEEKITNQEKNIKAMEKNNKRAFLLCTITFVFLIFWCLLKLFDIHVWLLNPRIPTKQEKEQFIMEQVVPYMYQQNISPERENILWKN